VIGVCQYPGMTVSFAIPVAFIITAAISFLVLAGIYPFLD
jgi:TctA family transporter